MTALPNAMVPLFDLTGEPTPPLRDILAERGAYPRGPLVDTEGLATPGFRNFLSGFVSTPLPGPSVQLADRLGRPTRVFTMLLAGLRP